MSTRQVEENFHQDVCKYIVTGGCGNPRYARYIPVCNELCTIGKIIMDKDSNPSVTGTRRDWRVCKGCHLIIATWICDSYRATTRTMARLIRTSTNGYAYISCQRLLLLLWSRSGNVNHKLRIMELLDKMFIQYRLPVRVTSENEPQFRSEELKALFTENSITHGKCTPLEWWNDKTIIC